MKRLLVIEPDAQTARQMKQYLETTYAVHAVSDVQEAVHYLDDHQVDEIILEPILPMHNGVEFLYEIRSYDDLQVIPATLYTSARKDQLTISTSLQKQLNIRETVHKADGSLAKLAHVLQEVEANAE